MNNYLLFIDTEATDLPKDWTKPFDAPGNWPYAVQISWVIYDKHRVEVKREDHYINIGKGVEITDAAFKIHGISPAYVADLKKSGISNLSADDLMSFKIHDVSAEYIAQLKNMGWNVNDHDAILSHKIHNITPEYAASMKATGINLSQEDLVAYKIHDITPEYIQSMKAAGFNEIYELSGGIMSWTAAGLPQTK